MTVHDAIPKNAAYRSVSPFYVKTRRGFCYSNSGERMNDCPRRYTKEGGLSVSYRYLTTLGFCSVGIVESCT